VVRRIRIFGKITPLNTGLKPFETFGVSYNYGGVVEYWNIMPILVSKVDVGPLLF
jgi:hypothetical protein